MSTHTQRRRRSAEYIRPHKGSCTLLYKHIGCCVTAGTPHEYADAPSTGHGVLYVEGNAVGLRTCFFLLIDQSSSSRVRSPAAAAAAVLAWPGCGGIHHRIQRRLHSSSSIDRLVASEQSRSGRTPATTGPQHNSRPTTLLPCRPRHVGAGPGPSADPPCFLHSLSLSLTHSLFRRVYK